MADGQQHRQSQAKNLIKAIRAVAKYHQCGTGSNSMLCLTRHLDGVESYFRWSAVSCRTRPGAFRFALRVRPDSGLGRDLPGGACCAG